MESPVWKRLMSALAELKANAGLMQEHAPEALEQFLRESAGWRSEYLGMIFEMTEEDYIRLLEEEAGRLEAFRDRNRQALPGWSVPADDGHSELGGVDDYQLCLRIIRLMREAAVNLEAYISFDAEMVENLREFFFWRMQRMGERKAQVPGRRSFVVFDAVDRFDFRHQDEWVNGQPDPAELPEMLRRFSGWMHWLHDEMEPPSQEDMLRMLLAMERELTRYCENGREEDFWRTPAEDEFFAWPNFCFWHALNRFMERLTKVCDAFEAEFEAEFEGEFEGDEGALEEPPSEQDARARLEALASELYFNLMTLIDQDPFGAEDLLNDCLKQLKRFVDLREADRLARNVRTLTALADLLEEDRDYWRDHLSGWSETPDEPVRVQLFLRALTVELFRRKREILQATDAGSEGGSAG